MRSFNAAISNPLPKSVKSITAVDADAPINYPPAAETVKIESEPRFLEQVQLFVDNAA